MIKTSILSLLTILFLVSCAPSSAPASPRPSPTLTITPTITPFPSTPAAPANTPYAPLQTKGPYLLFTRDQKNLILVDANGRGQKRITLPNNGYIFQLKKSVSPDGKWLAYFTGSTNEPYDLALNLLNLSDGTTQQASKLVASGFPENLQPIAENMVLGDPPYYEETCFEDIQCRRLLVQQELVNGLFNFDWSPDGRLIAFTAQIEGLSSDIYIYNIQTEIVRPLTNEAQNLYWLDWAPNGKEILYEVSSVPGTAYEGRVLQITDLVGKTTLVNEESLYNQRWGEIDWLTDSLYLLDHPNDTGKPPIYDLMTIDTHTGQLRGIWPYGLETFAINKENNTIVLIHKNHETQKPTVPEGIYMVYPSGKYRKISDAGIQFVLMQGQKPYPIFSQDYNGQIYSIDNDGLLNRLPWVNGQIPWISPDGKMLVFDEHNQLALYSETYDPIRTWSIEATGLIWRPDSQGLFLLADRDLYYLSIPQGNPVLVNPDPKENCTVQNCYIQYTWLP